MGVEPTLPAWEAEVLPINYIREIKYELDAAGSHWFMLLFNITHLKQEFNRIFGFSQKSITEKLIAEYHETNPEVKENGK